MSFQNSFEALTDTDDPHDIMDEVCIGGWDDELSNMSGASDHASKSPRGSASNRKIQEFQITPPN
jgi:hypothetical protein